MMIPDRSSESFGMATALSASRSSYLRPLVALVLIVGILYLAKPVIVPLALAVLLTFVLAPVVSAIQGRGLGRVPAVLLTAFLAFVLFGLVGWIVGVQVHDLRGSCPPTAKRSTPRSLACGGTGRAPCRSSSK